MKKLLIIPIILFAFTMQSQSLTEVFSQYIQPQSSTQDLRVGLKQVETLCATTPQEKCNKAKASALYLLADRYYQAAYQVVQVEPELATPIIEKAEAYYNQANKTMPLVSFPASQQQLLIAGKTQLEDNK